MATGGTYMSRTLYEAFGESRTAHAWSLDPVCVVSRRTFEKRVQAGWDVESALTTPSDRVGSSTGRQGRQLMAFGEIKSISAWATDPRCSVSRKGLERRLDDGWSPEDAISLDKQSPPGRTPGFESPAKGKSKFNLDDLSGSVKDIVERTGCSTTTARRALANAGSIPEKGVRTGRKPKIRYGVKYSGTTKELSELSSVSYSTLKDRLSDEWDVDKAVDLPVSHPSLAEEDLFQFVQSLGVTCVRRDRKTLGGKEIDIFVPDLSIGFEFNGLFWHSRYLDTYHHDKWALCHSKGIRLFQIWEDDWRDRRPIVEAMIASKLGKSSKPTVFARKCEAVALGQEYRSFLDEYHIQGAGRASTRLGLTYAPYGLVAAMGFTTRQDGSYELTRYGSSARVVGGFSKLLRTFTRTIPLGGRIVTFADLCSSDGSLYERCGFVNESVIRPDYSYVVDGRREHKFGYRIKRFRSDPELLFEEGLTEAELAALNGLPRVWDAGKIRYVYNW